MRPEVGHDHTEAIARNARCMAEPDPVHVCIGEQSMEQDDRSAFAKLVIRELYIVG